MASKATAKKVRCAPAMDRDMARILNESATSSLREIRALQRRLAKLIPKFERKLAESCAPRRKPRAVTKGGPKR